MRHPFAFRAHYPVGTRGRGRLLCAILALGSMFPVRAMAQAHQIAAAAPGLIESGTPSFSIRGYEAIGLDSPPTDLHVLPDGRLLLIAAKQIAFGDGVRWELFRQAADDPSQAPTSVNVDENGVIFAGVAGGFARVELGTDARWRLRRVADWVNDGPNQPPTFFTATRVGDAWFWHGDSGPLVAWKPGQQARTVGRADAIETVLGLKNQLFVSDRTNGSLLRVTAQGLEPMGITKQSSATETLTCGVPFHQAQLLVGTIAHGLRLFDGQSIRPFATGSRVDDDARINDLCVTSGGYLAAAIEGYGVVFLDADGRAVQILDSSQDRQLGRVRRLRSTANGMVVGLLNGGVLRIEFPSRVSQYESLVDTRLTTGHPYRFEGRLWLMSDGYMYRAMYDRHGRFTQFSVESPASRFVFSFSTALGRPTVGTDRGGFHFDGQQWVGFAPDSVDLRVLDPNPINGRWLYGAKFQAGWLRPTANGIEVESFATPQLENNYNVETDEDGTYWIEQGNGRLGRIRIVNGRPEAEQFDRKSGLPDGWAQVFKLGTKVGFNVGGLILRFDESTRRFVADETFARRFPGVNNIVGRPITDARGRAWITANGAAQVFEQRAGTWENLHEEMPAGFLPYYFTCEEGGVVWMHADRRLVRFDPALPATPAPPVRALITHLGLPNSGRTLFDLKRELPPFAYADNSFVAHFAASNSPLTTSVEFEVMLAGVGGAREWMPTGRAGTAAFNHLKEGGYVLHVRPRFGGAMGEEATLAFTIEAPWYRSLWAYFAYFISALGVVILSGRVTTYLERRKNARLEQLVAERTRELNEGVERRLRLEAQLLQAQKLESLGTLAGGIAHDFNNLLTSILGNCELALLNLTAPSPVQDDLLAIRTAGLRARDLVAQILTFSRKGNIKLTPLDLAVPVADALKLIRRSTPATIEIVSALESGTVLADATQVQQVVLNLCNNSIHAMRRTSGCLNVSVTRIHVTAELAAEVHGMTQGPAMRLTVADNGTGMDEATLARIFDPFYTTKAPGEGTGLGLSIVQGIAHSHRAALRVRSSPTTGTTFDLYFRVTTEPIPNNPAPPQVAPAGERQEILVVDDERSVAEIVARRLDRLGFCTTVFNDPQSALLAVHATPRRFHAIVTDLTMPGMTGVELINAIRMHGPLLPAVIITGYGTDAARAALSELPACVVLPKPFDGEDLARALREVLPAPNAR